MRKVSITAFLLIVWLVSLGQDADERVRTLMIQYKADQGSLERFYYVDHLPEKIDRFIEFNRQYLDLLQQVSYEDLSVARAVDYHLFRRDLRKEIKLLDDEKKNYEELKESIEMLDPLNPYEIRRRRGVRLDSRQFANDLFELSKMISNKRQTLEEAPLLSRMQINFIKESFKGRQKALQRIFTFYDGYDPEFSWWVSKPLTSLSDEIDIYLDSLDKRVDPTTLPIDDGSGIIGDPVGEEELQRLLRYELIAYQPEELVKIANEEFAWCDEELLKASREMGFGDNWQAAQEKVKESYVLPGHQPEAMLELYNQSVAFLKENELLTIPPLAEETWRMSMISPERQLINPFFLGGERLQISYPTDEMEHEDKLMSMRGNNPHFSRSTVHHELIAGHHLQGFMNNRYETHRNFRTPFWTEGWALYQELLLWDLGFPRGPEDRIGMLFWRMHRCARIIFSLNYHLGKWTPQQCIDFLVNRVGFERENAEAEVRRSFTTNYPPLYQLAYMTGGLQFWALKEEVVDAGIMTYREMHDLILRQNAMPVEMVRAIVLDQKPEKDFEGGRWKFY